MSTILQKANEILAEKNQKIIPENIKSGVKIFDIDGTLQGLQEGTADATAIAQDIVGSKTAYVNGEKLTGTLAIKTNTDTASNIYSTNYTSADSLTFEGEWASKYNRTAFDPGAKFNLIVNESEIADKISLTADKIVEGNTILGVEGTAKTGGIDTSDATATASDIVYGKTAYVNGEIVEGTIADITAEEGMNHIGTDITEFKDGNIEVSGMFTIFRTANIMNTADTLPVNETRQIINIETECGLGVKNTALAEAIGLTADKIKAGETILGITGTYTGDTIE